MIKAPKFPLLTLEKSGFKDVDTVKELVSFHIKNLLLTNPGEKISDLEYGVGIKRFLFENMVEENINFWRDRIMFSIEKYMTYIDLNDVMMQPVEEQNKIFIRIIYNLKNDTEKQILDIELSGNTSGMSGPVY